jgi:hypothetical protein
LLTPPPFSQKKRFVGHEPGVANLKIGKTESRKQGKLKFLNVTAYTPPIAMLQFFKIILFAGSGIFGKLEMSGKNKL